MTLEKNSIAYSTVTAACYARVNNYTLDRLYVLRSRLSWDVTVHFSVQFSFHRGISSKPYSELGIDL